MPRPPKQRLVEFLPNVTYFKPAGVPMAALDEVCLGIDEVEALRLKDLEGLEQEECAARMNLAQSTFQRILAGAREKLTRAIVEGKAIRIEGGHYRFVARTFLCPDCGTRWRTQPAPETEQAGEPASPEPAVEAAGEPTQAWPDPPGEPAQARPDPPAEPQPPPCPACGSRSTLPQWHPGRGRGPRWARG
ncbi:MAG: DUF134 domain-containing protein [Firmicutes bacterium]|nr:DUF134 domain-containing protein [Bacillota bacterium]